MSKLGQKIVSHLVNFDSSEEVLSMGITSDLLLGDSKEAFEYYLHEASEGRTPTRLEMAGTFPTVPIVDIERDDLKFLCDRVKKRKVSRSLKPVLDESLKAMEVNDPKKVLTLLSGLEELGAVLADGESGLHSYKRDGAERFAEYERVKKLDGIRGIESEWPSVNKVMGGWNGFIVLAAPTSTGKSWLISIIADDMASRYSATDCILMLSTEMDAPRLARRIDCVKYKIPFPHLRDGRLSETDEEIWAEGIYEATEGKDDNAEVHLFSPSAVSTVDDILALYYQYRPKAVIIDGGYRLTSNNAKGAWENQVKVIEDIQKATIRTGVPWIVTTQIGASGSKGGFRDKKTKTDAFSEMRYAKEWIINPDFVLLMEQTDQDIELERMHLSFEKVRDGDGPKHDCFLNWKRIEMDFSETDPSEFDSGDIEI